MAEEKIAVALSKHGRVLADDLFRVHPANRRAVRLFLHLATQWRVVAISTLSTARIDRVALDYGVVETTARMAGLGEVYPDDFDRLRALEGDALDALAEARS